MTGRGTKTLASLRTRRRPTGETTPTPCSGAPRPKVAIAHDYITQRGGAERVVLAMARAFPDAAIHTTLYNPETTFPEFAETTIVTSPLNRVGLLRRHHRLALPFLAWASSRMVIDADVVVASSSGWAHGFPATGKKFVYCHSPARWLYVSDDYLGDGGRRSLRGIALEVLRRPLLAWDAKAASTADVYVANAHGIAERIERAYGFEVDVMPPPFGVDQQGEQQPIGAVAAWGEEPFFLVVSRLMPYKNVDTVLAAMRGRSERLLVIGAGPLADELRAGKPENVEIVSGVSDEELRWAYAHCRALIAASYEDFGLTPLEGGAFGKPVAALRAGGYLDTVVDGLNGVFFDQATPEHIATALDDLRTRSWDETAIRSHVDTFAPEVFIEKLQAAVRDLAEKPEARTE